MEHRTSAKAASESLAFWATLLLGSRPIEGLRLRSKENEQSFDIVNVSTADTHGQGKEDAAFFIAALALALDALAEKQPEKIFDLTDPVLSDILSEVRNHDTQSILCLDDGTGLAVEIATKGLLSASSPDEVSIFTEGLMPAVAAEESCEYVDVHCILDGEVSGAPIGLVFPELIRHLRTLHVAGSLPKDANEMVEEFSYRLSPPRFSFPGM
jgi:hypothetical protein